MEIAGMDTLNKKLKDYRKAQGWTQEHIAKKLGITQSAYSQIEAGDSDSMRVSTLRKICTEFNMSADELLGLKKPILTTKFDPSFKAIMVADIETPAKGAIIIGKKKEEKPIIKPLTTATVDE